MENRTKVLQLDGNLYEVSYPTIQQIMDIEKMKIILSGNKYKELILQGTKWSIRSLDVIDMSSYLSVMCPKLLQDLKVDITKIDYLDVHGGLLSLYSEQFLPWWSEYEKLVEQKENPQSGS